MTTLRGLVLLLTLACAADVSANTITLKHLESILTESSPQSIRYQELRESPWLQKSEHSYGTLHSSPDFLEKRVEFPQPEVWRLYSDRIVRVESSAEGPQEIVFGDSGQLSVFTNALQHIVAGKLSDLQQAFQLDLTGDELDWIIRLKPRSATVQLYLEWIEVRGNGPTLSKIIVLEPGGDRTTTQLVGSRN